MADPMESLRKLVQTDHAADAGAVPDESSREATDNRIAKLHTDLREFVTLVASAFPDGHIPVRDTRWDESGLPDEVATLFEAEYGFQPEDIAVSIRVQLRDPAQPGIRISMTRRGQEWSAVNVNTWEKSPELYGINVGVLGDNGAGRVHAALDAERILDGMLSSPDALTQRAIRAEVGSQILQFAVGETIRALTPEPHER